MLDDSFNNEELSDFVSLNVNSFNNPTDLNEQFKIVKNVYIKTLPDGTVCLIEANDFNESDFQDISLNNYEQLSLNESLSDNVEFPLEQKFKCHICFQNFDKSTTFKKHMQWHNNVKKYKCDLCTVSFNIESNLKIHQALHSNDKPTCPLCNLSFQRIASLKSHLMLHQIEELFTCENCGSEFESKDELIKHLQTHDDDDNNNKLINNLICTYCKVEFDNSIKLKEHISHHLSVKKIFSGKKYRRGKVKKFNSHICTVCQKNFSKASLLERHIRVHSGERPFVCQYCHKGFNQKGALQIHLSKHSNIKPYHCTLCSARFNQKGNLRVHVEKTHTAPQNDIKTYKCVHCTCIFKKIATLNVHITKFHSNCGSNNNINNNINNNNNNKNNNNNGNVLNQLKELEKQTAIVTPDMKPADKEIVEQNKKILNEIRDNCLDLNHVRVADSSLEGNTRKYLVKQRKVNDIRWYMCNFCNKEFKKPSDLIRHTRIHTKEKPFICHQCGAVFTLKSTLYTHIQYHIGKKECKCIICSAKFTSMRTLNAHLKKHSDKQTQNYKCIKCNIVFESIDNAKEHKEIHMNEVNVIEAILKQPLVQTPSGLLPLQNTKDDKTKIKKTFRCQYCSSGFNKLNNFKRHMLLHTGEKQFKCQHCPKSYYSSHSLKEHLLSHTGIKNYGCKICGKKYFTSSLLKRHLITHNTIKPFVCSYCNKNFKTILLCRKHMKTHKIDVNAEIIDDLNEDPDNLLIENDFIQSSNEILKPIDEIQDQFIGINNNLLINNDKNSEIQTLFINSDNLIDNNNLYSNLYIQEKLEDNDSFFFNTIPVDNVFNNIDPSQFVTQTNEIYNTTTQILNDVINTNDTILPNINDLEKFKFNQSTLIDKKDDDNLLNQVQFFNNNDLNNFIEQNGTVVLNDINLHNFATNNYNNFDICHNCNKSIDDLKLHQCDIINDSTTNIPLSITTTTTTTTTAPPEPLPPPPPATTTITTTTTNTTINDGGITDDLINKNKKKRQFNCEQCKKQFKNRKTYLKHINGHGVIKKDGCTYHQCTHCEKQFKKFSDLTRHIRTHTGEKPFVCDKCDRKFTLKSTLISHLRTHNPQNSKTFICDVCNSSFTTKSSLKIHSRLHSDIKINQCSFCNKKFRSAISTKNHEANHHNSNNIDNNSNNNNNSSNNISDNNNSNDPIKEDKNYNLLQLEAVASIVNIEDNNVENPSTVPIELIVQNEQPLLSDLTNSLNILNDTNDLNETIEIDPLLLQHLQTNGVLLQDQFLNPVIELDLNLNNVVTTTNSSVSTTTTTTTTTNDLVSPILESNSDIIMDVEEGSSSSSSIVLGILPGSLSLKKNNDNLNRKLDKIRNLECDICHKKYASKDVLRKHKKTHGINKKFPCTMCDKGFNIKDDLDKHEQLHAGYRPYTCSYCANTFTKKQHLNVHLKRIHHQVNEEPIFISII